MGREADGLSRQNLSFLPRSVLTKTGYKGLLTQQDSQLANPFGAEEKTLLLGGSKELAACLFFLSLPEEQLLQAS